MYEVTDLKMQTGTCSVMFTLHMLGHIIFTTMGDREVRRTELALHISVTWFM